MSVNLANLGEFVGHCRKIGVEPPAAVARGLELRAVAHEFIAAPPPPDLLSLSDDEAREYMTVLSIRQHQGHAVSSRGMQPGAHSLIEKLGAAVRAAAMPELEDMVRSLQPRFAKAAKPLVDAVQKFGFTNATTPTNVLDMANERASAAYRAMKQSWLAIQPIVNFRIAMSKAFAVSPTPEETYEMVLSTIPGDGSRVNWSVAFAAKDNWSPDVGYIVDGKRGAHLDWLSLARDGLRLNTPMETREKIAKRGGIPILERIAAWNAEGDD